MSARSMTGFARTRRVTARGEYSMTLKGVNHRSLDLHFHTPGDLEPYEGAIRQVLKSAVSRGHVDVRMGFQPAHAAAAATLNRALFEAYLNAFREARELAGGHGEVDVNGALRIAGMIGGAREEEDAGEMEQELVSVARETVEKFNQFREREGAEIVKLMAQFNGVITGHADEIEALRGQVQPVLAARLEERLGELLRGMNLEPQRLAQETAVLVDRSDIAEETGRLKVHARELEQILARGGEMGKKLDFLLQEMNRETNTILSKTSGAGELGLRITNLGLEVKSNIERIREQSLNLE
jgi:uncharacterized protein (TIGR00255 family)